MINNWINNDDFYKGLAIATAVYIISFGMVIALKWFVIDILTINSIDLSMLKISLASTILPIILWRRAINKGLEKQGRAIVLFCFMVIIISFLTLN